MTTRIGMTMSSAGNPVNFGAGAAPPPPPPPPVPPATGVFHTSGPDILDRSGNVFIPIGANVGVHLNFGDDVFSGLGHSGDALAWGWNTVRLTMAVTTLASWTYRSQNGFAALVNLTNQFVAEYTGAGIVVMIEVHDDTLGGFPAFQSQIDEFWTSMANTHKTNDRVWFNDLNEYSWNDGAGWLSTHNYYYSLVRNLGAPNIFVVDCINGGNDQGWDGAPRLYSAGQGPTFISGKTNVVFALHDYAGNGASYFDTVRAAGLPLLIGEFGYTLNDSYLSAGSRAMNLVGTAEVFNFAISKKIGALIWHGTHTDGYSLKNSITPFWWGGNGNNLSQLGQSMWNLSH